MKVEYPVRTLFRTTSFPEPDVSGEKEISGPMPILAYPGLAGTATQFEKLAASMDTLGLSLAMSDYHRECHSIDEMIAYRLDELRELGRPAIIICHSMGTLVAANVAKLSPLVAGIIALSPITPRGIGLPPKAMSRAFRHLLYWPSVKAIAGGGMMVLMSADSNWLRDGSEVEMLPSVPSGVFTQLIRGYRSPRLSSLSCPAVIVHAVDDRVIPIDTARRIAWYHEVPTRSVASGGHFFFAQGRQGELARLIADRIRSWSLCK